MSKSSITLNQAQTVAATLAAMGKIGLGYGCFYSMVQLKELAGPFWGVEPRFSLGFLTGLTRALRERGKCWTQQVMNNATYEHDPDASVFHPDGLRVLDDQNGCGINLYTLASLLA